jgi:hypothetical protein
MKKAQELKESYGEVTRGVGAKSQPMNPVNHMNKLLNGNGFKTLGSNMAEFVSLATELLAAEDGSLFTNITKWKDSSKAHCLGSMVDVFREFREVLFPEPMAFEEFEKLANTNRKMHLSNAKRESNSVNAVTSIASALVATTAASSSGSSCSDTPPSGWAQEKAMVVAKIANYEKRLAECNMLRDKERAHYEKVLADCNTAHVQTEKKLREETDLLLQDYEKKLREESNLRVFVDEFEKQTLSQASEYENKIAYLAEYTNMVDTLLEQFPEANNAYTISKMAYVNECLHRQLKRLGVTPDGDFIARPITSK